MGGRRCGGGRVGREGEVELNGGRRRRGLKLWVGRGDAELVRGTRTGKLNREVTKQFVDEVTDGGVRARD